MSAQEVDEYLAQLDEAKRSALERLRSSIAAIIHEAEQGLSYAVPVFRIGGRPIAGFSAAKNSLSYLPHSGVVISTIAASELEEFGTSKGAVKFSVDQSLPEGLIRKLIEARRAEAGV